MSTVERCLICGEIIPEGRQVCPLCEDESHSDLREAHQRSAGASEKIITGKLTPKHKNASLRRSERERQ